MIKERTGRIVRVNGNMVMAETSDMMIQNEVAYVIHGKERLKSEVIRVRGNHAQMQVFETTTGISVGEKVEFTGELLSVELGPGLFEGLMIIAGNLYVRIYDCTKRSAAALDAA